MANCVLWYWLHKRQIVFLSRTRLQTTPAGKETVAEWERLCIYHPFHFHYFSYQHHNIYPLPKRKRMETLRTDVRKRYSGDIRVNFSLSSCLFSSSQTIIIEVCLWPLLLNLRRKINSCSLVRLFSPAVFKSELKCFSRSLNVSVLCG